MRMINWKQLREREAEDCFARQREEFALEEGFDVSDSVVTKEDIELMSVITKLEEIVWCNESGCSHAECEVVQDAIKYLIQYSYLRRSVMAHRDSKGSGVPVGGWSIEDRRLWDLVDGDR